MTVPRENNPTLGFNIVNNLIFIIPKDEKCVGVRKENSRPCDVISYGRFTFKLEL